MNTFTLFLLNRFCGNLKKEYFFEFGIEKRGTTLSDGNEEESATSLFGNNAVDLNEQNIGAELKGTFDVQSPHLPTERVQAMNVFDDDEESAEFSATLEQEKQQIFQQFKSQESEAIRETDQALTILSQLQNVLATHIQQQAFTIDKIYDDVQDTLDSISAGYDYLKKAKENSDEFLKTAVWLLLILAFILLFLDWYN